MIATGPSEAPNYRLLTTQEALVYLREHGLTFVDSNPAYTIGSGGGLVYTLPNGEVVLLQAGLREGYPAFVFSNVLAFKRCRDADFFPIPQEHMEWLEAHASQVQNFLSAPDFYLQPLHKRFGLTVPFRTVADCETAFLAVRAFIRQRGRVPTEQERQEMTYFFALAATQFLVEQKGYKWQLRSQYASYNPYYTPMLLVDKAGRDVCSDVISAAFSAMSVTTKDPFRTFYWFAANVPPVAPLD